MGRCWLVDAGAGLQLHELARRTCGWERESRTPSASGALIRIPSVRLFPTGLVVRAMGGEGASILCRSLMTNFRTWFEGHDYLPDGEAIMCWIDQVRDRLSEAASQRGVTRRQFAATLVMLVVFKDRVLALQIDDSALVARKEGVWDAVCWPENGEFASTTYFVTDDPEVRLHTFHLNLDYDAFALFSDGLESVALEQATKQPFARFFDPMIRPIDQVEGEGRLVELSGALARYLDSPALCERTDDDKTLVLVSCR